MTLFRRPSQEPLWKDEVSFRAADERYVSRRQFAKFTVLTSMGMFAGNLWLLVRSWLRTGAPLAERVVARAAGPPAWAGTPVARPHPRGGR